MAYLHCHRCGWEQDDFWDYNNRDYPIQQDHIEWLRDLLQKDTTNIQIDGGPLQCMDTCEVVAIELERMAKRIRGMHIKTFEEFKKVKNEFQCPKCGAKKTWDID
jgi:rubredoxin